MTVAVRALSVLALLAMLAGCGSDSPEKLLDAARAARERDQGAAALIAVKNALQLAPDSREARALHGELLLEAGDPQAAEGELRRALELGASTEETIVSIARAQVARRLYQEVLDETAPLVEGSSRPPATVHALRGHAQLGLDRVEQARRSYALALALDPANGEALFGEARLAILARKSEEAMELLTRAVQSAPRHAEAQALRGDLLRLSGDEAGATAAYQRVLAIAPLNHNVRLSLASIHIGAQRLDDAMRELDAVRAAVPDSPTANFLTALIEFRRGQFDAARNLAAKVLSAQPNHPPSLLMIGASAFAARDYATAERALTRGLQAAPGNLYARKMLGASLARLGRGQAAIEVLLPGLKIAPGDRELLSVLGEAYIQVGDFSRATEYLDRAAAIDPDSAAGRLGVGFARLAAGETERAVADLEAAYKLAPQARETRLLLAMGHLKRRDFDRTLEVIGQLDRKDRDNPVALNVEAAALIGKKDLAAARTRLERALKVRGDYMPAVMNLVQLDLLDRNAKAALGRLEAVIAKHPDHVPAMLALANLLARLPDRQEEVLRWLERAHKAQPTDPEPLLRASEHLLARGMRREALDYARRLGELRIESPETLDRVGRIQVEAGDLREALGTYVRLASEHPKLAFAHYRLGWIQARSGNQAAARQTLRRALELAPDFQDAAAQLAMLEAAAGNVADALRMADGIDRRQPKSPAGSTLRGDVLLVVKRPAEAIRAYEAAWAKGPSGPLAMRLHQAHTAAGDVARADAALAGWLQSSPQDVTARQYLADAALHGERFAVARDHYEALVLAQPTNQQALNNLAWAYLRLGDPRAVSTAERAWRLNQANPLVTDTYGWMLVQSGDIRRGTELIRAAASGAPDVADVRYHLGAALAAAGNRREARSELEKALAMRGPFSYQREAKALLEKLRN